jgi:hypothetical protein
MSSLVACGLVWIAVDVDMSGYPLSMNPVPE